MDLDEKLKGRIDKPLAELLAEGENSLAKSESTALAERKFSLEDGVLLVQFSDYANNFNVKRSWQGYDDGFILETKNQLYFFNREIKNRMFFCNKDPFEWKSYGKGAIVKMNDNLFLYNINGYRRKIIEKISSFWGYGNGIMVSDQGIFNFYDENGEIKTITQPEGQRFGYATNYGYGVIIRFKNNSKFVAYNLDGTTNDLYEGNCDENFGYKNGVIVRKADKFYACNRNGSKKLIYQGPFDDWRVYGNGVIIQYCDFSIPKVDNTQHVITKFIAFDEESSK